MERETDWFIQEECKGLFVTTLTSLVRSWDGSFLFEKRCGKNKEQEKETKLLKGLKMKAKKKDRTNGSRL